MYHLGARIRLLVVVGEGDGIEFRTAVIPLQDGGRVFPGDGGACFHLGPAEMRPFLAYSPLSHEIEDSSPALRIAGIPVLHRGIAHVRIFLHNYLHHCRMKLVFIAHGRRAAFHIAQAGAFVGDDEGAFELSGAAGVDAEVAAEVHGAFDALWNIAEGTVGENCRIQRRIEIIARGHYRGKIFPHKFGMLAHSLAERAEDDAEFGKFLPESGAHAHGIEDRIHGHLAFHSRKHLAFADGDAEFVEGLLQRRIYFLGTVLILFGCGVVDYVLEIYFRKAAEMPPFRRRHFLPPGKCLQAEIQQPLRLGLLCGNKPDNVLIEALGHEFLVDFRDETFLVFLLRGAADYVFTLRH